jgi:hypothetical protein
MWTARTKVSDLDWWNIKSLQIIHMV